MPRPVFFSVGGPSDTKFAASVKELLPDSMVYMYTRTGEEGVAFRPEIEQEVQACRLFVVFWSDDYLKSEAATIELAQARRLAETIDPMKQVLVVPVKRKGPNLQAKWTNPLNSALKDEFILGKWRLERALDGAPDAQKVAEFVRRKLEDIDVLSRILVSRPPVLELIRSTVIGSDFRAAEFVFISGLEGDGRRTALRQLMKSSYGNLTERQVSFDSAEGTEDLLLRMLDSAGTTVAHREQIMLRIADGNTSALKEIRRLVHQARAAKSYYVVTLDRFSGADTVNVPSWVSDVFGIFDLGNSPLVFLVTSSPVTDAMLLYYPKAKRIRVPGLDEREMAELVHRLSNEDGKTDQWSSARRKVVQNISGSSPSLCQTIMMALRSEQSLDFLEIVANREEQKFASNMSAVLGHIVQQFKSRPNDILALRVVERLGLTSKKALDELIALLAPSGSYDLYRLMEYGLIERLSDDVLRIPPLIERRLGYILEGSSNNSELDRVFEEFGRQILVGTDEYGAVYASNKATTNLATGGVDDPRLLQYLTTASLFKVGLDRYLNYDYAQAHSIFARAIDKLLLGASIDLSAQVEIARYFGLAAARMKAHGDVVRACQFLEVTLDGTQRAVQGRSMASFLRGFELRQQGHYAEAIAEFEQAKQTLGTSRHAERQRGAILTELSRAYLRRIPPDYQRAVEYAQEAYDQKDVAHNLSGLIRARLHRAMSRAYSAPRTNAAEIGEIRALIDDLALICVRTDRDFHLFREAELEVMLAIQKSRRDGVPLDLSKSIALIDRALVIRPLPRTRFYGWKLRAFDERSDHSAKILSETRGVLDAGNLQRPEHVADAAKVWSLIKSRTDRQAATAVFQRHRDAIGPWSSAWLGKAISAYGKADPGDVFAVIDRL